MRESEKLSCREYGELGERQTQIQRKHYKTTNAPNAVTNPVAAIAIA